jgi:hypothetical protein
MQSPAVRAAKYITTGGYWERGQDSMSREDTVKTML